MVVSPVDAALLLLRVELVGLASWRRCRGRAPAVRELLPGLLAGACLLLALGVALSGACQAVIVSALGAALLAHSGDPGSRRLR